MSQFSTTLRNQWATDLNTALGASAKLYIYSGTIPANVAASPTGTLLSSGCLGNAAGWGNASGGVLTANAITADSDAVATGVAGYFRWLASDLTVVFQGTVTVTSGGGDLTMANTTITQHNTVTISAWVETAPGA